MRQKELRIALICYGGISLAVYMHGVTKELWKLTRASRAFIAQHEGSSGIETVYHRLLHHIRHTKGIQLRVLPDIVSGASAGGINGVFLAQAIHSGQSLEPLTQLWLERADVDILLDPDARPWSRFAKMWAMPIVWYVLRRPGNVIASSVAPETREEVRAKLSRLIRSRWFEPPFSGKGLSHLLAEALEAMAQSPASLPLLPEKHPLDLFVTATDFKGHMQRMRLNSPETVEESEHRLSIGFRSETPGTPGISLAALPELVLAARATASFPGAFPPVQIAEIVQVTQERQAEWPEPKAFMRRVLPEQFCDGTVDQVSLIDGSVLVNAPFAQAIQVLRDRPAQREVDRRFVYIDPRPDRLGSSERANKKPPGFFSVIFGSLSSIPREQPVRDNLEALERQSREMARLRTIIEALRPEVEEEVERLFGRTLFLNRPNLRRLANWRGKAHKAAAERAGFAYHGYAQVKFAGVVDMLASIIHEAAPGHSASSAEQISRLLTEKLSDKGLDHMASLRGGASVAAVEFFRSHDLAFRIRRLRLMARRLTEEWTGDDATVNETRDAARHAIYQALAIYLDAQSSKTLGEDFPDVAAHVFEDPLGVLEVIATRRDLRGADDQADAILTEAIQAMPRDLRRDMLLTYLGFPFYDTVTLPLLRDEGLTEFQPAKVDRISPDDALSIRAGGTDATLRGTEFFNFGAFFSRAYRENDYLWGRLHGAERMIDLVASTLPDSLALSDDEIAGFKRDAFLAILDEEEGRLTADTGLIRGIRTEVLGQ